MLKGLVINAQKNLYSVKTEEGTMLCHLSGRILKEKENTKSLVVVGDNVLVEKIEDRGIIREIEDRKTEFFRRGVGTDSKQKQVIASNIDQLIITCSVKNPLYKLNLIDRYLVAAREGNIEPIVCFNKVDLIDIESLNEDIKHFSKLGIRTIKTSAYENIGITELREILKDKISVFSGSSGVGKSSLVNAVQEDYLAETSHVGETTSKGRHTTTSTYLYELSFGGMILDTPGMREFSLFESEEGVKNTFNDIEELSAGCKFNDCSHVHEPKCNVKRALDEGEITEQRYSSYLKLNKKKKKVIV